LPTAHRAIAQIAGQAFAIPTHEFLAAAATSAALHAALHGYTQALIIQIAQGSVCNRVHPVQQRCVRWLLQTHDRVGADRFRLTQQFLGQMLGAGRARSTTPPVSSSEPVSSATSAVRSRSSIASDWSSSPASATRSCVASSTGCWTCRSTSDPRNAQADRLGGRTAR
jgi:hypothetical protein